MGINLRTRNDGLRRRGRSGAPAKPRPNVRGARYDESGEARIRQRLGSEHIQPAEEGGAAENRQGEQPVLAMVSERQGVAEDGKPDKRLRRDEKLRFVDRKPAEAEKGAEQGELWEADRASRGGNDRSNATELVQVSIHVLGGEITQSSAMVAAASAPYKLLFGLKGEHEGKSPRFSRGASRLTCYQSSPRSANEMAVVPATMK